MTYKKPLSIRFKVSYDIDVPLHGIFTPEEYIERVKNTPEQVREIIVSQLVSFDDYTPPSLEPEKGDIDIKFIRFSDGDVVNLFAGLLPPRIPDLKPTRYDTDDES